jgi:uncharacterized membrane protein
VNKEKWYLVVGISVLVMVVTLLVRIPVPGGGFFNMGAFLLFSQAFLQAGDGAVAGV